MRFFSEGHGLRSPRWLSYSGAFISDDVSMRFALLVCFVCVCFFFAWLKKKKSLLFCSASCEGRRLFVSVFNNFLLKLRGEKKRAGSNMIISCRRSNFLPATDGRGEPPPAIQKALLSSRKDCTATRFGRSGKRVPLFPGLMFVSRVKPATKPILPRILFGVLH